jgi:prevent-host-death family protein
MNVPVTEAKARLNTLLREAESDDVILLRHGRPAGVLVSYERYEDLMAGWEDAIDARAVAEFRANPEPGGMRASDFAAQLEAERRQAAASG